MNNQITNYPLARGLLSRKSAPKIPYFELCRLRKEGKSYPEISAALYVQYSHRWHSASLAEAFNRGKAPYNPVVERRLLEDAIDAALESFGFRHGFWVAVARELHKLCGYYWLPNACNKAAKKYNISILPQIPLYFGGSNAQGPNVAQA